MAKLHGRRLVLFLALLPQLLALGLGRGVVVCVAPGGHLRLEVAGSACCADPAPAAHAGTVASQDESDCGACTDLGIALDPRLSRRSSAGGSELAGDATAALPVETRTLAEAAHAARHLEPPPDRGFAPPHLLHLRSVVRRC